MKNFLSIEQRKVTCNKWRLTSHTSLIERRSARSTEELCRRLSRRLHVQKAVLLAVASTKLDEFEIERG
jgi:hypothetical protein